MLNKVPPDKFSIDLCYLHGWRVFNLAWLCQNPLHLWPTHLPSITNHALTMATKILVFKVVVLYTLLYVCKTWTLYRGDIKVLECFQDHNIRQILRIPWETHTTNLEVLNRASMISVEATIIHYCFHWWDTSIEWIHPGSQRKCFMVNSPIGLDNERHTICTIKIN